MDRLSRRCAALLPLLWLSSCTTVSITNSDGAVRIERYFGVVSVELAPGTKAVVAEVSSIGYLASPMGDSVGFAHSTIAALSPECHLVIWLEQPEQIRWLNELLAGKKNLCVIKQNDKTKEETP